MLKLHQKSITFSQQGFAIIPLLMLIVIGIAAGVYLTQTGTSFLPKAQQITVQATCNNNTFTKGQTTNNCTHQGRVCSSNGSDNGCPKPTRQADCDNVKYFKDYGFVYNSSHGLCELPNGIRTTSGTCSAGGSALCTNGKTCKDLPCPADNSKQCYMCNETTSTTPPSASATQPGVAGDCPAGRQLSCSSGEVCKLDHVGTRWCTDPNKKEGDSCGTNCIIIGGLKKAPYPNNTPENGCNINDKAVCTDANNEECAVFKKNITVSGTAKDVWYSACRKKTGTAPAAGGPAAAAPRSGAGAPAAAPASTNPDLTKPTLLSSITQKMRDEAVVGAKEKTGALAKAQRAFSRSQENAGASIDQASVLFADTYIIESIRDALKKPDWSPGTKNIIDQAKKDGLTDAQINKIVNDGVNALNQLRKNEPKITASSLQSFTNSTTTAAAPSKLTIDPNTAVNCGLDKDSINIPCYQIGVFADYDTLTATEAQASIATQRYLKSQEILNAVKGKVDDAIFAAAQDKLNKAKEKAAACMKQ